MTAYTEHLLHDAVRVLKTYRDHLDAAAEYAKHTVEAVENGELPEAYRLAVAACRCEETATGDCRACAPLRDWLATERQAEGKRDDEDAA